ncbi:MAG TPA: hypothetical protein VFQ51_20510, partial [Vicinamibacteria bacterium]|nr:hypothetical protein [Vicinamibacteria bacterium]
MRGRLLINGLRTALALGLVVALPGCGGNPNRSAGEFVESLVRLLSARFVPSTVVVPRGATRTVDFEVTCDNAALNTTFGRLGIRVRLDPERRLPPGLAATIAGSAPDPRGFSLF